MRSALATALAVAVMLVSAGAASAASVSLEWAGTGGSNTIFAAPGVYTVDVVVTADAVGISMVSLSLNAGGAVSFVGMVTDSGNQQECISPPNIAPGVCFAGGGIIAPATVGVGPPAPTVTQVFTIEALAASGGPVSASFMLAQAVVNVWDLGVVSVFFDPVVNGVFDNVSTEITESVDLVPAIALPEPATEWLLLAGVAALSVLRRKS